MYAVRRWDEEVVKWMAVGLVLSLAFGLFVLNGAEINPVAKLYFEYQHGTLDWGTLIMALPELIEFVAIVGGMAVAGAPALAILIWAAMLGSPLAIE